MASKVLKRKRPVKPWASTLLMRALDARRSLFSQATLELMAAMPNQVPGKIAELNKCSGFFTEFQHEQIRVLGDSRRYE